MISFSKPAANYVISRFQEARGKAGNNGPKLLFHGRLMYALGKVASAELSAINRSYARGLRAEGSSSPSPSASPFPFPFPFPFLLFLLSLSFLPRYICMRVDPSLKVVKVV